MEKTWELLNALLPEWMLKYFNYIKLEELKEGIIITLEEKNWTPEIEPERAGKKIISKWFKDFLVEDFPIRWKKVTLRLRRRIWKIEDEKKLLKRKISIIYPGTKLEKDFGFFLKEWNWKGTRFDI